jgi:hypothetical protein
LRYEDPHKAGVLCEQNVYNKDVMHCLQWEKLLTHTAQSLCDISITFSIVLVLRNVGKWKYIKSNKIQATLLLSFHGCEIALVQTEVA